MARPREFDEDDVLDRALSTFWDRGYAGTSIDDLVEATGLGRASLYGAFGDKERVFTRALAHYCARMDDSLKSTGDEPSARAALERLFDSMVIKSMPKSGPRGCFLLCTAVGGGAPSAVRAAYAEYAGRLEKVLTAIVHKGQENGEFTRAADAKSVARMLVTLLQGLAATARAGHSKAQLQAATATALALIATKT
jgi:TetR/AcrR family transcriptional repressor of nem operon